MKVAYVINRLQIGKTVVPASTPDNTSLVKLDDKKFERFEALGAVRLATSEEKALGGIELVDDKKAAAEKAAAEKAEAEKAAAEKAEAEKAEAEKAAAEKKAPKGSKNTGQDDDLTV